LNYFSTTNPLVLQLKNNPAIKVHALYNKKLLHEKQDVEMCDATDGAMKYLSPLKKYFYLSTT
jgi:hypothetical protein